MRRTWAWGGRGGGGRARARAPVREPKSQQCEWHVDVSMPIA